MFEREASALGDKVGELERAIHDSLWFFNRISFGQAFDAKGENIDKGESPLLFVLRNVHTIGSNPFSHILSRLVNSIVKDSKILLKHVNCELSHKRGFTAAYRPYQTDR